MQVGYTMHWTKEKCVVEDAEHRQLPALMIQGRPTVLQQHGDELMALIEGEERKRLE